MRAIGVIKRWVISSKAKNLLHISSCVAVQQLEKRVLLSSNIANYLPPVVVNLSYPVPSSVAPTADVQIASEPGKSVARMQNSAGPNSAVTAPSAGGGTVGNVLPPQVVSIPNPPPENDTPIAAVETPTGSSTSSDSERNATAMISASLAPLESQYNNTGNVLPGQSVEIPETIPAWDLPVAAVEVAPNLTSGVKRDLAPASSNSPSGSDLSPADFQTLYNDSNVKVNGASVDGSGVTVGVVVTDIDPEFVDDLDGFDTQWTISGTTVNQIECNVDGSVPVDDTAGSDEALSADLEIEFVHTIAPGATIDIFEVPDTSAGPIGGIDIAGDYSGVSVVEMGIDYTEFSSESSDDGYFLTPSGHQPDSFFVASGDNPSGGATYPSASSNVISVGGTQFSSGTSGTEEWWSDSEGGASLFEGNPIFQDGIAANRLAGSGAFNSYNAIVRITPDIAMAASSVSVYDITDGSLTAPWVTGVSGTALSSSLASGVMALVNEGRTDAAQTSTLDGPVAGLPSIYGLPLNGRSSDLNDIESSSGAGPGYDTVTGLGSLDINNFVKDMSNVDSVLGTTSADTITASEGASSVSVTVNGSLTTYTLWPKTSLFIYGESGSDSIDADSTVSVATVLFGGGGADTVLGGSGEDFIDGSGGNDSLNGGAGDDYVAGGPGEDTVKGGADNDTLIAGLGGSSSLLGQGGDNIYISDQALSDTLTSQSGSSDSGYYDDGPTTYDSVTGTITLL